MKLSEAIRRGSKLLKPEPCKIINEARTCGCALGMAAVGASLDIKPKDGSLNQTVYDAVRKQWPWLYLTQEGLHHDPWLEIAMIFDNQVVNGEMSIDGLVTYVESIEPAEQVAA